MHSEWYQVTEEAANTLNAIRASGGRLICVGTTSVRTIETVATEDGIVHPGAGDTAIFIYPGKKIKAVDALITNFHLPQSTLLMLDSTSWGARRHWTFTAKPCRKSTASSASETRCSSNEPKITDKFRTVFQYVTNFFS